MNGFIHYLADNASGIWGYSLEHLRLTMTAVTIAVLIGVPLGILISYIRKLYKPVVGFANIVQAVPSLALLGFLIPLMGIGALPGISMVVIYSLLPIIKNTSTGLGNIDRDTLEAAKGIGMTKMQILLRVKLPLALPVIMTGVRISAVTAVGLVTLAAFIGAGGLGYLVYSGIRMVNTYMILSGALPACAMALMIDYVASLVERVVVPISFRPDVKSFTAERIRRHRFNRSLVIAGMGAILLLTLYANLPGRRPEGVKTLTVASKDYTEQIILGHMFAELVEDRTGFVVDRKFGLGGTHIVFGAMRTGEVDMYIEYSGTAYGATLGYAETRTADEVFAIIKKDFAEKYRMTFLDPIGFNNTYAMMVTPETAKKYSLVTVSDLSRASPELVAGPGMEFAERHDGLKGLIEAYGMRFKEIIPLDGGVPKYTALLQHQVHTADAFSTDGTLMKYNMVILEDDKHFFPPYHSVPLVRDEVLAKYPELQPVLNLLAGAIDDAQMRSLNYQVDVEGKQPKDVAIAFLRERGLLTGKTEK